MKGSLVSNTGPIIALSAIDHLEILKKIFEEVILPETVHHEIMQGGKDFTGLGFYRKFMSWDQLESFLRPNTVVSFPRFERHLRECEVPATGSMMTL